VGQWFSEGLPGLGCHSLVEHLHSMHEALCSIPSTGKKMVLIILIHVRNEYGNMRNEYENIFFRFLNNEVSHY
jgi:hypothetical protein